MSKLSFSFENPLKQKFGDEFFKNLPNHAGVYFFLDRKRQPLYIGKADSLKKRLASYRNAKPGQAPEHILEMIEHAEDIVWEIHESGTEALKREGELIRATKPPFNISGTWPVDFLYCGLKTLETNKNGLSKIDFRLSHRRFEAGFETYGCFLHRGKTKAGFAALLRLLFVVGCERDRFFHLPAKLCRTSPSYIHSADIPDTWIKHLEAFLSGENTKLLKLITEKLLAKENIEPHLYAPLNRDLKMARDFFDAGPKATKKVIQSVGLSKKILSQKEMEKYAAQIHKGYIRQLTVDTVIVETA